MCTQSLVPDDEWTVFKRIQRLDPNDLESIEKNNRQGGFGFSNLNDPELERSKLERVVNKSSIFELQECEETSLY